MNRLRSNIWFGIAVVFAACVVVFALDNFVLDPAHMVPELGGDGAKNNLTYLYHSMYGKGYWFDGMNYPYGEHIVYTDGQPLLSAPLTYFKNVSQADALRVMWLLISASFFLSIVFLYLVLVHFKVAPWAAMLFAGLIGIFSPQLFRLQGHYALSYACVIPMLFYWTIRYLERATWRYPVCFAVTGCLMSFIHPYYAAMMLIWVACYAAGYFVFTRQGLLQKARHTLPLIGSTVLVLAVVAVVMKVTDPVTDRPESPFNSFYETLTHIKQIITSSYSPVWQKAGGKPRYAFVNDGGEGNTYVGLAVVITVLLCFAAALYNLVRKRRLYIVADSSVFSPVWLFMAFMALLFSMGAPFIWHMQWLFEYFSFFRQFRSLGRFSWIFYYIIAVYAAVVLYSVYARCIARRRFVAGYTILVLSFGLWGYEASGYVSYAHMLSLRGRYNYNFVFSEGEPSWAMFLKERGYSADKFQAIVMLPFFHIGTEKLWVGDPSWLITLGSRASLQLHLPVVDVMMSRSSWSQALKQVKTVGGPFAEKPMLRDIKSDKAFLVLHFEDDPLNPDQKYLLEASDSIGHFSQCNVYACYPGRISANDKRYADSIEKILPAMMQADTVLANDGVYYYNHYDKEVNRAFFGAGGGPVIHSDDTVLVDIPVTVVPRDSELYEFSCWFLVGDKDYRTPYITLQLLNDSGRVVYYPDALTKNSTDNLGLWLRAASYFYLHANCSTIRVKLINTPRPTYLAMDELLLRPARALVVSKAADGRVMVNNHLVKVRK